MKGRGRQHGSVLVITLILLAALLSTALLATQASVMELFMGSNEYHRLRALAAAETGLATAEAVLRDAPPGSLPAGASAVASGGSAGDSFDWSLRDGGEDLRAAALSGGARQGHLYAIAVTGHSLRGAQVRVEAGVDVLRDGAGHVLGVQRDYWLRRDVD